MSELQVSAQALKLENPEVGIYDAHIALPYLKILAAQSEEVKQGKGKPGQLFITQLDLAFDSLYFIPITMAVVFNVVQPQKNSIYPERISSHRTREEAREHCVDASYQIEEQHIHAFKIYDYGRRNWFEVLFYATSTRLAISKNICTQIVAEKNNGVDPACLIFEMHGKEVTNKNGQTYYSAQASLYKDDNNKVQYLTDEKIIDSIKALSESLSLGVSDTTKALPNTENNDY